MQVHEPLVGALRKTQGQLQVSKYEPETFHEFGITGGGLGGTKFPRLWDSRKISSRLSTHKPEQVANEPLIVYTRADYPEYHSWLSGLFAPLKRRALIAEEHDGATSLIASVESGRGVALVQQGFDRLSGPRLKVRPLTPKQPPHVVGVAYRRNVNSSATKNFIAAAKRSATSA